MAKESEMENVLSESKLTLDEAISKGLVDKEKCTIRDPISGSEIPLEEAIKVGMIDAERSAIYDSGKGDFVPLSDVISSEASVVDIIKHYVEKMEISTGLEITNLISESKLTLDPVMAKGFVDKEKCTIRDPISAGEIPLEESINMGLIDAEQSTLNYRGKVVFSQFDQALSTVGSAAGVTKYLIEGGVTTKGLEMKNMIDERGFLLSNRFSKNLIDNDQCPIRDISGGVESITVGQSPTIKTHYIPDTSWQECLLVERDPVDDDIISGRGSVEDESRDAVIVSGRVSFDGERPCDSSHRSSFSMHFSNQSSLLSESQLHLLRYNSESSDQNETEIPIIAERYQEELQQQLRVLSTLEKKLSHGFAISLVESENQIMVDYCQDISNEITRSQEPIQSLVHKVERFLFKMHSDIAEETENQLNQSNHDLKTKFSQLQKEISCRLRSSIMIFDEFEQFNHRAHDCAQLQEKLEKTVECFSRIDSAENLGRAIVDMKSLESEFGSYQNDTRVLDNSKLKLIDKIQKFNENKKRFCELVSLKMYEAEDVKVMSTITHNVEELSDKQRQTYGLYKTRLLLLTSANDCFESLKQTQKQVDAVLNESNAVLATVNTENNCASVPCERLYRIHGEFYAIARLIKSLMESRNSLPGALQSVGISQSTTDAILAPVDRTLEDYSKSVDRVKDLLKCVNHQSLSSHDAVASIVNLEHWFTDIEHRLGAIGALSLDVGTLNDQDRLVQTMFAEIRGRQPGLENLVTIVDEGNADRVQGLLTKMDDCTRTCSEMVEEIANLRITVDNFNVSVRSNSDWLSATIESLSDRMFVKLEEEKILKRLNDTKLVLVAKDDSIQELKAIANNLLTKENCRDQTCVESNLENLCKIRSSLDKLIISRFEELNNRNEFGGKYRVLKTNLLEVVNGLEHDLTIIAPLAVEISKLNSQNEEIKTLFEQWESRKTVLNEFCEVGSEFDLILQGFPPGSVTSDQPYRITSPLRRSFKIKPVGHNQSQEGSAGAKVTSPGAAHQQCSGSESSGVSSADYININQELNEVALEMDDIKNRYSEIGDRLNSRRGDLQQLMMKCQSFEDDYGECSNKFDGILSSIFPEDEQLENVDFDRINERIRVLKPLLDRILSVGYDLLRNREFVPGSVEVKEKLKTLERKHSSLLESAKKQVDVQKNVDSQRKKFAELKRVLDSNIMRKERMVNVLGPVGTSFTYANSQLEQVNALRDEIEGISGDVNDLSRIADDILRSVSPTSSEASDIESTLGKFHRKVDELSQSLREREANINAIIGPSRDFYKLINVIEDRLTGLQDNIDMCPINDDVFDNIDWIEVQTDLNSVKTQLHDVDSLSRTLVSSTSDETAHYDIKNKVGNLTRHCRDIQIKIDKNVTENDRRNIQEEEILRKLEEAHGWIVEHTDVGSLLASDTKMSQNVLLENMKLLKTLQGDIQHKRSQISDFGKELGRISMDKSPTLKTKRIHDNITEMLPEIDKIEVAVEEFAKKYQEASVNSDKINNDVKKIESWVEIETQKMDRQYPIGLDMLVSEEAALEQTLGSIDNKLDHLLGFINTSNLLDIVDSSVLLATNVDMVNVVEASLLRLKAETRGRLDSIKECHDKILSVSETLGDLQSNLSRINSTWQEIPNDVENSAQVTCDIGNLEKDNLEIQKELGHMESNLSNTKSMISSIAESSHINAQLLEPEWKRANDKCEALRIDVAHKLQVLKSKQKSVEDYKVRVEILSVRMKNLKEKIDNFPQPSLDLDSLEDQIQDMSSLLREAHDNEGSIEHLKLNIVNLAAQGCIEAADVFGQKLLNIKSTNQEIIESIEDHQSTLRLQHDLVTEFECQKNDLLRRLEEVMNSGELNTLQGATKKSSKTANEDVRLFIVQRLDPLKKDLEQVVKVGNEACSTVLSGIGFKHIEQETESVKQHYDKLMNIVSDIENNVDKNLMMERNFESTVANLSDFISNIKNEIMAEEEPSIEYHKSKSQLNTHRLLLDRLKKRGSSLEKLNKLGSDIVEDVDENRQSIIRSQLSNLNKEYGTLMDIANEKFGRYEKAVKLSKAFKDLYEPSLAWLDAAERDLANLDTSPTTDTTEIEMRIDQYQALIEDIQSRQSKLSELDLVAQDLTNCSSDNDVIMVKKRVEMIHEYFDENKQNALQKLELFRNSVPVAERFLLANNKLDLMLPSLTALVRDIDSGSTPVSERHFDIIESEAVALETLVLQARSDLEQLKTIETFEKSLEKVEDIFLENEKSFRDIQKEVVKKATLIGSNKIKAKNLENSLQSYQVSVADFQLKIKELCDKINGDTPDFTSIKTDLGHLLQSWNVKKVEIIELLNEARKHIRQSPGTDTKGLKSMLNEINKQTQSVTKTMECTQLKLDEIIPLYNEYKGNQSGLLDWFRDTEESMSQSKINNFDPEQLYMAKYETKTLANSLEDQKPSLDKMIKTGRPLVQLLSSNQGKIITAAIDDIKRKYKDIKEFIRLRTNGIEDLLQINTQLNDKVDQCVNQLDNVRDRITDCYQPSVHPEKLEEELTVFDEISLDLCQLQGLISKLKASVENCATNKDSVEDQQSSIEVLQKLGSIHNSTADLQHEVVNYKENIIQLLDLANQFWIGIGTLDRKLTGISTDICNIAPDSLSYRAIGEKQEFIEDVKKQIVSCENEFERVLATGLDLIGKVENPNEVPDIEQVEEDVKRSLENVKVNFEQQRSNIDGQKSIIEKIETIRSDLDTWFEVQNGRLIALGPLPTETRPVLGQIDETKEIMVAIEPKHRDIETINQLSYQLTKKSHLNITKEVNVTLERINESWKHLLDSLGQRQHQLQCILLSLGEFHRAIDEFMEWIANTEYSLTNIKIEYGDVSGLELGLSQHKMIRANINIQQASYNKIERKAAEIIKDDVTNLGHEASERLATLNQHWDALKEKLRSKHYDLEDALKESLIYFGDQQEIVRNIEDMATKFSKFKFSGGLPDTAKEQLKRFMEIYKMIPNLEAKISRLKEDSKEITNKASPTIKTAIEKEIEMMEKKWSDITSQAESRKSRLEKAIETVESFHSDMAKFINWLTVTENSLNQQRPVSRILSVVVSQIEQHNVLKRDITSHREELLGLDKVATHLKYLSQKHDIVLIRNLMSSIHHRWERVVSRSSERSRNLDYAHKEVKRFEDMSRSLLDMIEENLSILEQDTFIGQSSEVIREQIVKHQEFQCRLGVHNMSYDETRRFGQQLREKAIGPEKTQIEELVHHLQVKWQNLCNKSMERERTLNDALLLSGHYKDALDNLLSWLRNIEPNFKEKAKGCCGDINTVQILIASHNNFEKEMKSREKMVEKIKKDAHQLMTQSEEDTSFIEDQLSELFSLWENINSSAVLRKQSLEEARTQALEFDSQWNSLKDMFAKSEHGLRHLTISPDEDSEEVILNMIASSKKFHKELFSNDDKINSFQRLGHEILSNAHHDAEEPIKHYLNIIKSEWSELLNWSEQRSRNLQDQLDKSRQRKVLLDDLLVWLATAEGTLVASEHRDMPCSATEAKFQFEEHERFIMDMTLKQKDHDEIVTNAKKKSQLTVPSTDRNRRKEFGSNQSLNKDTVYINPKINQLHAKWQKIWLMTMSRRKRLVDHNEHLKEVEKMKNFDFNEWRNRYMAWMKHSKSRVMDLFRRYDTDHDGRITRKEFIDGILESRFPTSRLEMDVVADRFDKEKTGFINYTQFIAALHPDRESYQAKESSENSAIDDEVKKQVSKCSCDNSYKITQCGEGKYRFGDNQKLRLVRILRSTVMVRIGGGWSALDEFLVKHDPCRDRRSVEKITFKSIHRYNNPRVERTPSYARSCQCPRDRLVHLPPINPNQMALQRRKSLQASSRRARNPRRLSLVSELRPQVNLDLESPRDRAVSRVAGRLRGLTPHQLTRSRDSL